VRLQPPKSGREDSSAIRTARAEANKPAEPESKADTPAPRAVRSVGLAMMEIAGSLVVFYLGIHFDNSVVYGNATPLSIAFHGFAIYGIGAGVAGLWPR
jgi:hypothetical protein